MTPVAEPRPHLLFSDGLRSVRRLSELVETGHPSIDADALAPRIAANPPTVAERTPYRGIACRLVEPPVTTRARAAPRSGEEAVRLVRRALEGAIDRAIVGAKRVAVLTGGGLDSGGLFALTALRARLTGASVFAVGLDFEGPGDDRPYLRALEESTGCEVVRIAPEEGATRLAFLDGVDVLPFVWLTGSCEVAMFARARADGADVALMGAGGDELWDGRPQALAAHLLEGHPRLAWCASHSLRGFHRPRSVTFDWLLRPLIARALPRRVRAWRLRRNGFAIPAWYGPRIRAAYVEARERQMDDVLADAAWQAGDRSTPEYDMHLASLRHQEEIASGCPRRDPFLDRELIAAIATVPPLFKLHGHLRRGLFRAALADVLPRAVAERLDKAQFEPALARFLAAAGGPERLRALADAHALAELDLVDRAGFKDAFDHFASHPLDPDAWITVWPALAGEAFLRAVLE